MVSFIYNGAKNLHFTACTLVLGSLNLANSVLVVIDLVWGERALTYAKESSLRFSTTFFDMGKSAVQNLLTIKSDRITFFSRTCHSDVWKSFKLVNCDARFRGLWYM